VGGPSIALEERENVFVSGAVTGEEDGIHTSAATLSKFDSEGNFGLSPKPVFVTKHYANGRMLWPEATGLPARIEECRVVSTRR
jgi:hypothetical protein